MVKKVNSKIALTKNIGPDKAVNPIRVKIGLAYKNFPTAEAARRWARANKKYFKVIL